MCFITRHLLLLLYHIRCACEASLLASLGYDEAAALLIDRILLRLDGVELAGVFDDRPAIGLRAHEVADVLLRDLVGPYLLRRVKADVALKLPKKTEQVLFCPLTQPQREAYRAFLASKDCEAILEGRREALAGIDVLRKIVNHPDLLDRVRAGADPVRT